MNMIKFFKLKAGESATIQFLDIPAKKFFTEIPFHHQEQPECPMCAAGIPMVQWFTWTDYSQVPFKTYWVRRVVKPKKG